MLESDPAVHEQWIQEGLNVGFPLEENGRSVIDFDEIEPARAFWKAHRNLCTVIVRTRRGVHFHFSGSTQTRKFAHGDIKGNGYVVYPPSVIDNHQYEFIARGELQGFPESLFHTKCERLRKEVKNVRSYISRIESIQGQNGSAGLIRAASVCRDAGLSESQATIELLRWNEGATVRPPWDHSEIARAVTNVYGRQE